MFIKEKKERDILCELLTEKLKIEEFISTAKLKSENGKLIMEVIKRLAQQNKDKLPEPYIKFLADVCKNTPVAGLGCVRQLDVRNGSHSQQLNILTNELPALWPQLVDICNLENSNFLPRDIAKIVLILLAIRNNTFKNSPQRFAEDYIRYESEFNEDPTQYYPMHKLLTFPKLYNIANKNDEDFCEKKFPSHHDFADGILSIINHLWF